MGKHLSFGKLWAFAVNRVDTPSVPHLQECLDCQQIYNRFLQFAGSDAGIGKIANLAVRLDDVCQPDAGLLGRLSDGFLLFMQRELDETQATKALQHINGCYPCLEAFSVNWNDFLSTAREK